MRRSEVDKESVVDSKVAKVVIDISFLLSLAPSYGGQEIFSSQYAEHYLSELVNVLKLKNIPLDRIEFSLLTHSEHHESQKFQKVLTNKHSELFTYSELENQFTEDGILKYLWGNVEKKFPCISRGHEIVDKILTRIEEIKTDIDKQVSILQEKQKQIPELKEKIQKAIGELKTGIQNQSSAQIQKDKQLFNTLQNNVTLLHSLIETKLSKLRQELDDLRYLFDVATENVKNNPDVQQADKVLLNLEQDSDEELKKHHPKMLRDALKDCQKFFSNIPLLFNPRDIEGKDEENQSKPTLLLVSPFVKTLDNRSSSLKKITYTRAGEASKDHLSRLKELMNDHKKNPYKEIIIYIDFDHTLCNIALAKCTKNIDDAVNPDILKIASFIKKNKNDASFKLLTSRVPLKNVLASILNKMDAVYDLLDSYEIPYDLSIKDLVKPISAELKALTEKKGDLHEEIDDLKALYRRLSPLTEIDFFIYPYSESIPQKVNSSIQETLKKIKITYHSILDLMDFMCVSNVTKKYKECHNLSIEISNDRHLSSQSSNFYKADYIFNNHKHATERTLVLLVDDNEKELILLRDKIAQLVNNDKKINANVDIAWIKINSEGHMPSHSTHAFVSFLADIQRKLQREHERQHERERDNRRRERANAAGTKPTPDPASLWGITGSRSAEKPQESKQDSKETEQVNQYN